MHTLARARLYGTALRMTKTMAAHQAQVNTLARARLHDLPLHEEIAAKPTCYKALVDCYLKPLSLQVQQRMQHFVMMQADFENELNKRGFTFDKASSIDEVSWERENCDPGFEYEVSAFFETWGLKFMDAEPVARLTYNVISIQHMIRYDRLITVMIKRAKSKDRITVTVKLPI